MFIFNMFVENAVSFCALTKKAFCLIVTVPVKTEEQWY